MDAFQRRPGETAEEFATRLVAFVEEERRQKEEERRQKEEERRQKEEERRQKEEERRGRLQAELELRRRIESDGQRARFFEQQMQQNRDFVDAQSLPAYLAQVSRLQTHAIRLLPLPPSLRQRLQPQQGNIPPHVQRSSASDSRTGIRPTSTQITTTGRTDIVGKYYPLRLCPWAEFQDEVQQDGFARIYNALAQQHPAEYGLPSRVSIQDSEKTLLRELPLLALNRPGALNAERTSGFLKSALLAPAAHILDEYLKISESGDAHADAQKNVFFDTAVQSVETVIHSASSMEMSDESQNAAQNDENVYQASKRQLRKVRPDCLVLCMDSSPLADTPDQLVASAEHKPLHALRAESVSQIIDGTLPESLVVRLAQEASARTAAKQLEAAAEQAPSSVPGPASARPTAVQSTSKAPKINKLTYFAYALAQTYHYMLMSGVEFGYLATGEVIVFLRIPKDEATTLYYHVSLSPVSELAPENSSGDDNPLTRLPKDVTHAPYPAPGDPVTQEELAQLPIAQLVSFCEHARHAERRSTTWVVEQLAKLATFPNLPASVAAQYDQLPPSQLGRRRRDDDDNEGDGDNNTGSSNDAPRGLPRRGGRVQSTLPCSPTRQRQGPSHGPSPGDKAVHQDITTTFLSTTGSVQMRPRPSYNVEPPTLPYCTHACLLSLVQGGPLDTQCPNVHLHRAAATGPDEHALPSALELARRIRDQLYDTPEVDCEYSPSSRGAIGYPFKLTLSGYGYTFIGKAVRKEHRRRLVRESIIYKGLLPLQGSLIPVHLGLIQLHVGYPILDDYVQLPYMMLMSYAGESMVQSLVVEDDEQDEEEKKKDAGVVHDRAEAARTQQELRGWGLDDADDNVSNFRWCVEAGRAMRIDFDRAHLVVPLQSRSRHLRLSTNTQVSVSTHVSQTSQQSASSHNTPTTPTSVSGAASANLQLPLPGAEHLKVPDAKRRKIDAHETGV